MANSTPENESNLTPAARVLRMHALRERLHSQTTELLIYGFMACGSAVLALPWVQPENYARATELLGSQAIVPAVLLGTISLIGLAGGISAQIRMSSTTGELNRLRISNRFN